MLSRPEITLPVAGVVVFGVIAALTDTRYNWSIAGAAVSDLAFVLALVCLGMALMAWRRSTAR